MQTPSSSGSVLRWPSAAEVMDQAERWARQQAADHSDLLAVGVHSFGEAFGYDSYGRGDAGVGSDLDLVLVLERCELPIWERLRRWDTAALPLATDLLVYSMRSGTPCRNGTRGWRKPCARRRAG